MQDRTVIVVCDTSIKEGIIVGYQQITNQFNEKVNNSELSSTNWFLNSITAGEAITLLNLVYYIYCIIKYVIRRSIIIYSDNIKAVQDVNRVKYKVTEYAVDRGVVINTIVRLINKLKINVIIEYQRDHKKHVKQFEDNPQTFLL